jgi:hypothetical protein
MLWLANRLVLGARSWFCVGLQLVVESVCVRSSCRSELFRQVGALEITKVWVFSCDFFWVSAKNRVLFGFWVWDHIPIVEFFADQSVRWIPLCDHESRSVEILGCGFSFTSVSCWFLKAVSRSIVDAYLTSNLQPVLVWFATSVSGFEIWFFTYSLKNEQFLAQDFHYGESSAHRGGGGWRCTHHPEQAACQLSGQQWTRIG